MNLCTNCFVQGYCERAFARIVSDEVLSNASWLIDFKRFLVQYSFAKKLKPGDWQDHLADLYCNYKGWIRGPSGEEIFLDTQAFEIPHIREWFRDFIQPIPQSVRPRIRGSARERVRVLATIMRAHYPVEASLWGVRAANDNELPISPFNNAPAR